MMKLLSHLRRDVRLASKTWHESKIYPGIRFSIRTISLRQRIELLQKMQHLLQCHEFRTAGDLLDQAKAKEAELLAEQAYLEWAIVDLDGFQIDGRKPSVAELVNRGPERLSREIVDVIRGELDLSEDERKN